MPHFRVDDGLNNHPKARLAGVEAMGLWVVCGSYCMAYLTDGFVPEWYVKTWPKGIALAKRLVAARFWDPAERDGEKGWQFHEFVGPGRQDSRQKVEADRELARKRKQKSRRESQEPSQVESHRDTPVDNSGTGQESSENRSETCTETVQHNGYYNGHFTLTNHPETSHPETPTTSTNTPMSQRDYQRDSTRESRRSPGYTQPNPTHISTSVVNKGEAVTQVAATENHPPPQCHDHPNDPDRPCRKCQRRREYDKQQDQRRAQAAAQRAAARRQEIHDCDDCDPNGWLLDADRAPIDPSIRCPNHTWEKTHA